MNEGLKKLKKLWDEKPAETIIVLSTAIFAIAKLTDSVSAAQGRRAYSEQVKLSKIRAGV
jgi:hypothetical protein